MPNDKNVDGFVWGKSDQNKRANIRVDAGAIVNIILLIIVGLVGSFINNFIASAIGCGIPNSITLFGPFRS